MNGGEEGVDVSGEGVKVLLEREESLDVEIVEVGEGGEEAGEGLVEGGDWVVGSRRGATGTRAVPSSLKISFTDSRNILISTYLTLFSSEKDVTQ